MFTETLFWKLTNKIKLSITIPLDSLLLVTFEVIRRGIKNVNFTYLVYVLGYILSGIIIYYAIGFISDKRSHRKEFLKALACLEPLMNQDNDSSFYKVFMKMGINTPDNSVLHLDKITLLQSYFYSFQKNAAGPYDFKQLECDVNALAKNIVNLSNSFKKHKEAWDMNHAQSFKEMISNYDDFISKMKDMCRIYHWRDDNFIRIGSILND